MKRLAAVVSFAVVLSASIVSGQMQLGNLYSTSVRLGYYTQTSIDSLEVQTRVNLGLAVTKITFVARPGRSEYEVVNDTILDDSGISVRLVPDSIEMVMNFQLPTDFVADSLWLWIDGEPVSGYIQDRTLAAEQYREIVGRRRDPAILESQGFGSWLLRIFPALSMEQRKVSIEFHHTFADDSADGGLRFITAALPVSYDSSQVYYSSSLGPQLEKAIGFMTASFIAGDQGEYSVDIPGLGSGTFAKSDPLQLSGERIFMLGAAKIAAADPSGNNEFLWTGRDSRSDNLIAGVSVEISDANVQFDPEPDTRIIMIDLRDSVWNWNDYYRRQALASGSEYGDYSFYGEYPIVERARKYAVLALRQYLKEGYKFNVLLSGPTVRSLFEEPLYATAKNIDSAVQTILTTTLSFKDGSTEEMLAEAIRQAPQGLAILITDLFTPSNYNERIDGLYRVSSDGVTYDSVVGRIETMMKQTSMTLFTVDDNYRLLQIALQSGGFRLGGVLNRYNIAYRYEIVEGRRLTIPQLPDLFGSSNYSGIRNMSVQCDRLEDIAWTLDGNIGRYHFQVPEVDMLPFINIDFMPEYNARTSLPTNSTQNSMLLRVAGRMSGSENTVGQFNIVVRAKTGGLWFTRTFTASGTFARTGYEVAPYADPQWAMRKSEKLAFDDLIANGATIKAIGREYHIVTRQTTLLALENGMELWEDTTLLAENTSDVVSDKISYEFTSSARYATIGGAPSNAVGSGYCFDDISIYDILSGNGIAAVTMQPVRRNVCEIRTVGSVVMVDVASIAATSPLRLRLFDLKGRLIAQKNVMPHELSGTVVKWNIAKSGRILGRGVYTMHISNGSMNRIFRITHTGN